MGTTTGNAEATAVTALRLPDRALPAGAFSGIGETAHGRLRARRPSTRPFAKMLSRKPICYAAPRYGKVVPGCCVTKGGYHAAGHRVRSGQSGPDPVFRARRG